MNKTKVTFQKVTSVPKDIEEGRIYFNEETNNIYLGDSDTAVPYSITKIKIGDNEYSVNNGAIELPETDLSELDNKVDKEEGKGLSTNDYTTEDKNKLAGIEDGAQVNVQSDWEETDTADASFIRNKPDLSAYTTTTMVEDMIKDANGSLDAVYLTITENDDNTFTYTDDVYATLYDVYLRTETRPVYINNRLVTYSWFFSATPDHVVDVFIGIEHWDDYVSYKLKRYWFCAYNDSKDKTFEYVYSKMKAVQDEVSDPSADGEATSFIDTISQDRYGVITVTKKNIPAGSGLSIENGAINHSNSITAGSVGKEWSWGTFPANPYSIPHLYIQYDAEGHIIKTSETSFDIPYFRKIEHNSSDTGSIDTPYNAYSNYLHTWSNIGSLYLNLKETNSGEVKCWMFRFSILTSNFTISLPENIIWAGGIIPEFTEVGGYYEILIIDNLATCNYYV